MRERPVIAAMLETGDSFLHLEQQEVKPGTAEELGYEPEDVEEYDEYVANALKTGVDESLPNYHTVAEKLVRNPEVLYNEELLRPEVYDKVEQHLELLRDNRDRSLNLSEVEAVINTTMEEEETFSRRAVDKEKLLGRLYIGVYSSPSEDVFHESRGEHVV